MKPLSALLMIITLFFLSVPAAMAVDIVITDRGDILWYDSQVLGDKSEDEQRQEKPENRSDEQRKPEIMRTNSAAERKELQIKAEDKNIEIRLQNAGSSPQATPRLEKVETMKSERLQLQMPANLKATEAGAAVRNEQRTQVKDDLKVLRSEYQEQLREARQERKQEMIEIRNQFKEQKQQLLLESRNVRAQLKNGAQFTIDPKTNEIMVTTPSGNTHILNHLPDQAIERMKAAGVITESDELEIESADEGTVTYTLQARKAKKLLGVLKREIPVEVKLDDSTGEVNESELERSSVWQRLLDRLSY